MNQNEIMEMAREASSMARLPWNGEWIFRSKKELMAFAALVAAKEREACAQVCDAERQDFGGVAAGPMTTDAGKRVHEAMAAGAATCAAAIRARGQKEELV